MTATERTRRRRARLRGDAEPRQDWMRRFDDIAREILAEDGEAPAADGGRAENVRRT